MHSIDYLCTRKGIFIDVNKRISVSNDGTILHCLMCDPYFIIRTLKSLNLDLLKFVVRLGADIDRPDKFGETPVTLVAKLNVKNLIKMCSG